MRLVSGIARRVNSGSSAQRVHLKAGIVGQNNVTRGECAVVLSFFPGVGLEGKAILDRGGNGGEIRQGRDGDAQRSRGPGEIAKFAGVRGGDEDTSHSANFRRS